MMNNTSRMYVKKSFATQQGFCPLNVYCYNAYVVYFLLWTKSDKRCKKE
jgi:hypothetical protein